MLLVKFGLRSPYAAMSQHWSKGNPIAVAAARALRVRFPLRLGSCFSLNDERVVCNKFIAVI